MVFVTEQMGGAAGPDQMWGLRVDGNGTPLWVGQPLTLSSVASGKGDQQAVVTPDGGALVVWEDDRDDVSDVYTQRINEDGTLGPGTGPLLQDFLRADVDNDGVVSALIDGFFLLNWGFSGGAPPPVRRVARDSLGP